MLLAGSHPNAALQLFAADACKGLASAMFFSMEGLLLFMMTRRLQSSGCVWLAVQEMRPLQMAWQPSCAVWWC